MLAEQEFLICNFLMCFNVVSEVGDISPWIMISLLISDYNQFPSTNFFFIVLEKLSFYNIAKRA